MQFDLRTMAEHMGGVAWGVVIVLCHHVHLLDRRDDRALLHLPPGHQAVAQVRARGGPLPEAGQDQGGDRRLRTAQQ